MAGLDYFGGITGPCQKTLMQFVNRRRRCDETQRQLEEEAMFSQWGGHVKTTGEAAASETERERSITSRVWMRSRNMYGGKRKRLKQT